MTEFSKKLVNGLVSYFRDMSNPLPFQENHSLTGQLRSRLKAKGLLWARKQNLFWLQKPERSLTELAYIFDHLPEFEQLYESMGDANSKDCLIEALHLRLLGPYYVRAGVNTQTYWDQCHELERHHIKKRSTVRQKGFPLCHQFTLKRRSRELNCHASTFGIGTTFFNEQYAYRTDQGCVCANEGDVVIDGGGYLGETALYFAEQVVPSGKVFTFEFNQEALSILQENLRLNPELARATELVTKALWHQSRAAMEYVSHGPSTCLRKAQFGAAASDAVLDTATTSIDDFVQEHKVERLDFIKMDIEGAELKALQGSAQALRRFRPKLAIAIYHQIEDFLSIPGLIRSLDLGYRFFLRHAYVDDTETILFAAPPDRISPPDPGPSARSQETHQLRSE